MRSSRLYTWKECEVLKYLYAHSEPCHQGYGITFRIICHLFEKTFYKVIQVLAEVINIVSEIFDYRWVLAGIMSSVGNFEGCKHAKVPYLYTSIQHELCFIDFDVKCKHGIEFKQFIDYETECSTWYEDQLGGHTVREIRKFTALADTCHQMFPVVQYDGY